MCLSEERTGSLTERQWNFEQRHTQCCLTSGNSYFSIVDFSSVAPLDQGWPEPYIYKKKIYIYDIRCADMVYIWRTVWCIYGPFGWEITQCAVIHNVFTRFWPTLH
jgi:hypothetical protein